MLDACRPYVSYINTCQLCSVGPANDWMRCPHHHKPTADGLCFGLLRAALTMQSQSMCHSNTSKRATALTCSGVIAGNSGLCAHTPPSWPAMAADLILPPLGRSTCKASNSKHWAKLSAYAAVWTIFSSNSRTVCSASPGIGARVLVNLALPGCIARG